MTFTRYQKFTFAVTALLFSTLACRAATRLIIPDTPTPQPTLTATFAPTLTPFPPPTATPTVEYIASCPLTLSQIIADGTASGSSSPGNGNDSASNVKVTYIVDYSIIGGELKNPVFESVPKSLQTEQKDQAAHEEIWKYFARLIPAAQRAMLDGFSIITDGKYNILAGVNQSDSSPAKWDLNVDFADSTPKTELTYTLVHEFGHLLTLNSDQVVVDMAVYRHPEDKTIYQREADACPQYFTGEGCSNPDSYINQFFERFWTDFYAEWQTIDAEPDEDKRYSLLDDFYHKYQDQFLTDYAPTSPAEDIAESWAFFVLAPKPEDNSIANEKILFFYEYPELVQLRAQILDSICTEFQ